MINISSCNYNRSEFLHPTNNHSTLLTRGSKEDTKKKWISRIFLQPVSLKLILLRFQNWKTSRTYTISISFNYFEFIVIFHLLFFNLRLCIILNFQIKTLKIKFIYKLLNLYKNGECFLLLLWFGKITLATISYKRHDGLRHKEATRLLHLAVASSKSYCELDSEFHPMRSRLRSTRLQIFIDVCTLYIVHISRFSLVGNFASPTRLPRFCALLNMELSDASAIVCGKKWIELFQKL